jgi:hypothetical protein
MIMDDDALTNADNQDAKEYDDLVKIARTHLDQAVLAQPNDPQLNATVGVGYAILALVDRYVVKD